MVKKFFIIMVLAIASMSICVAQNFSVEKLKHCVWNRYTPYTNERTHVTYTDSLEIGTYSECSTGKWLSATSYMPYYLSSKEPKSFDFTRVGKKTKGKYLIRWNYKMNKFYITQIDSLSDSILVLRYDWGTDRYRKESTDILLTE